jgi:hypothetical protein
MGEVSPIGLLQTPCRPVPFSDAICTALGRFHNFLLRGIGRLDIWPSAYAACSAANEIGTQTQHLRLQIICKPAATFHFAHPKIA